MKAIHRMFAVLVIGARPPGAAPATLVGPEACPARRIRRQIGSAPPLKPMLRGAAATVAADREVRDGHHTTAR